MTIREEKQIRIMLRDKEILLCLAQHGGLTLRELMYHLHLPRSPSNRVSTWRTLKKLEGRGWVTKEQRAGEVFLSHSLTTTGEQVTEKIREEFRAVFRRVQQFL